MVGRSTPFDSVEPWLFVCVISRGDGKIAVPYTTGARSVGVFLGMPLGAAILTRFSIRAVYFAVIFTAPLLVTTNLGFGYRLSAEASRLTGFRVEPLQSLL